MACKGICIRHKAQKPVGSGRYATGQKRCQICELFIRWDGLWCPCCGYRLRTRPRNLRLKAQPLQKLLFNRNYWMVRGPHFTTSFTIVRASSFGTHLPTPAL